MCDGNFVMFAEQQSEVIHTVEPFTSALLAIVCVCAFLSACELLTTPHKVFEGKLNSCATLSYTTFLEMYLLSLWELAFQINVFSVCSL